MGVDVDRNMFWEGQTYKNSFSESPTSPLMIDHIQVLDSFKTPYIQHYILEMPISDISSDLTIEVGSASFALHKFPLVLQSGRIRKLLLETKDTKVSRIYLTSLPGGSDAFELAAKFCYGVNVKITISNVVLLRCTTRFMEMIEDISEKNLEIRTEGLFIKDLHSLKEVSWIWLCKKDKGSSSKQ
ncbi:hypothetical protein FXO38_21166 [Capsicum annuum]|nr:hypothetical protein FXO38_21166 [Capsicum annuum]